MRRLIAAATIILAVAFGVTGCTGDPPASIDAQANERFDALDKASRLYPVPKLENYPLRQALVEFTERQDEIKPWYVYLLGMDGNAIGYYVAKTVPINSCNFLSSTEKLWQGTEGRSQIFTAPSLDGIYYGGGGTQAGCDSWFFFDEATNALIQIRGVNFFAVDQQLVLDAKPIKVALK